VLSITFFLGPSTSKQKGNVSENGNGYKAREDISSFSDSDEVDDEYADVDYVPSEESTDSENQSVQHLSSKPKVKKNLLVLRQTSEEQELCARSILEKDLYLSDDETSNDAISLNEETTETGHYVSKPSKRKVKNKSSIKQPGKKRVRHCNEWLSNVRKQKSLSGQEYVNKLNKIVPAKVMKPPCSCPKKCHERISERERQDIFNGYWSAEKSNDIKRQYIRSCIDKHEIARSRKRDENSGKSRTTTLSYSFIVHNQKINVCKVMFLNTLCISNKVVVNVLKKTEEGGLVQTDLRGKHTPSNKTPTATIDSVKSHISSFPCYESHYSREKTKKKYLGPELTIAKMYTLYTEYCLENNIDKKLVAKPWLYSDIFNKEFNLSFKPPDNDTCDICDAFNAKLKGDLTLEEKTSLQAEQDAHIGESKRRYELKNNDTKLCKENSKHKVLTCDLQKCLPTPLITNSISFYKRKLWTYNFTIFDSSNNTVHCVMWDESKGARGGNEMASGLLKWADSVIPNSDIEEITIWTDNCYGQNKNKSIVMAFFWILKSYPQIKRINQKFLLKGHTHMEADTVHAHIEKKRKKVPNMTILTPWDWQQLVRQTSTKYTVHNMELSDFKKLEVLFTGKEAPFVTRKTDSEKQPILMSTCVHLQVRQETVGKLFFKVSFDDDFRECDMIRFRRQKEIRWPTALPSISQGLIPISKAKYDDLMSLLPYLPTVCHSFYKDLCTSSDAADYPEFNEDVSICDEMD
jgi:hypothetical protein